MGFRNPVTSLSASQITPGTFPGGVLLAAAQILAGNLDPSVVAAALAPGTVTAPAIATGAVVAGKVAAGAIDGITITGALVRSSATGNRFELKQSGTVGTLTFYDGSSAGFGTLQAVAGTIGATPINILKILGDVNASGGQPSLALSSENAPAGGWQTRLDIAADVVWLTGTLEKTKLDDPSINGYKIRQGVAQVTTDSAGNVDVYYSTPFPSSTFNAIAQNGWSVRSTTFVATQMTNFYADHFRCRVVDGAGNGIGTTLVTINYVAWGT